MRYVFLQEVSLGDKATAADWVEHEFDGLENFLETFEEFRVHASPDAPGVLVVQTTNSEREGEDWRNESSLGAESAI